MFINQRKQNWKSICPLFEATTIVSFQKKWRIDNIIEVVAKFLYGMKRVYIGMKKIVQFLFTAVGFEEMKASYFEIRLNTYLKVNN